MQCGASGSERIGFSVPVSDCGFAPSELPVTGRSKVEHLQGRGVGDAVWPLLTDALDRGASEADLLAAVETATERSAVGLTRELSRRSPQMLRDHRAVGRGMRRRMRAIW